MKGTVSGCLLNEEVALHPSQSQPVFSETHKSLLLALPYSVLPDINYRVSVEKRQHSGIVFTKAKENAENRMG